MISYTLYPILLLAGIVYLCELSKRGKSFLVKFSALLLICSSVLVSVYPYTLFDFGNWPYALLVLAVLLNICLGFWQVKHEHYPIPSYRPSVLDGPR